MELVFQKSMRGSGKVLQHDGYLFRISKRIPDKTYWQCTRSDCKASIILDSEEKTMLGFNKSHCHAANPAEIETRKFYDILKQRIRADPSTAIPEIYRKTLSEQRLPPEILSQMPAFESVRQSLYNWRTAARPPVPETNEKLPLDGIWRTTSDGKSFLRMEDVEREESILLEPSPLTNPPTAGINVSNDASTPIAEQEIATPILSSTEKNSNQFADGYVLYARVNRRSVITKNPDKSLRYISHLIRTKWRQLPVERKIEYEERAQQLKEKDQSRLHVSVHGPNRYACQWDSCDHKFENQNDLTDHLVNESNGHIHQTFRNMDTEEFELQCMWHNCQRINKYFLPFPNIARLVRHVKEVHLQWNPFKRHARITFDELSKKRKTVTSSSQTDVTTSLVTTLPPTSNQGPPPANTEDHLPTNTEKPHPTNIEDPLPKSIQILKETVTRSSQTDITTSVVTIPPPTYNEHLLPTNTEKSPLNNIVDLVRKFPILKKTRSSQTDITSSVVTIPPPTNTENPLPTNIEDPLHKSIQILNPVSIDSSEGQEHLNPKAVIQGTAPLLIKPTSGQAEYVFEGWRLVNMGYFIKRLRGLNDHDGRKCNFWDMKVCNETKYNTWNVGIVFQCQLCPTIKIIWMEDPSSEKPPPAPIIFKPQMQQPTIETHLHNPPPSSQLQRFSTLPYQNMQTVPTPFTYVSSPHGYYPPHSIARPQIAMPMRELPNCSNTLLNGQNTTLFYGPLQAPFPEQLQAQHVIDPQVPAKFHSHPSHYNQVQVPIIGQSRIPLISQSRAPMIGHSRVPMIGQSRIPMIGQSQYPIIGPGQYPIIFQSHDPIIGESQDPVISQSQDSVIVQSQNPISDHSPSPIIGQWQDSVVGHSQVPIDGQQQDPLINRKRLATQLPDSFDDQSQTHTFVQSQLPLINDFRQVASVKQEFILPDCGTNSSFITTSSPPTKIEMTFCVDKSTTESGSPPFNSNTYAEMDATESIIPDVLTHTSLPWPSSQLSLCTAMEVTSSHGIAPPVVALPIDVHSVKMEIDNENQCQ